MKQKKKMTSSGFLLLITIVLFFVMYAAGMVIFADKGFAKPQMFLNLFVSNAGLLVISCGLTIVMITGGIDISVGSVTALVCMVMADLMENKGASAYVAVAVALGIGLLFGIVQGFLVTYMGIQPFIVTLAGMFFGRGLTAIISTDMIAIKNKVFLSWANYRFYMPFGSTNKKGKFIPAYIPPTVIIALIVVVLCAILLKYRKFGRKLYAIGGNKQSALMMGLDVKKTMFKAYVLDGFLAGLGGFLFCLNSCAGFVEQAKGLEMDAISSAVIGGTLLSGGVGTPIGTMFGVLIKGTISSLITAQGTLSSWWVRIVLSALLCFFIVIQSVLASAKKKKRTVRKKVKKQSEFAEDDLSKPEKLEELEAFDLFFLEDPVPLEQIEWLKVLREQTSIPIAQGELFNNACEWKTLITERYIDYIRVHLSQIGGITPARKLQIFAEQFGVRTAWHGPGDMSPVAHAANIHIDLAAQNFGVQEWSGIEPPNFVIQDLKGPKGALLDVFPGLPEFKNGYVYANDKPGLGVDIDEDEAKKYPCENTVTTWTQTRLRDGALQTP